MCRLLIKILFMFFLLVLITNKNLYAQVSDKANTVLHQANYDTLNINIGKNANGFLARTIKSLIIRRNSGNVFVDDREASFLEYEDKKIRHIIIKVLKPFGSCVKDTSICAHSWLQRTGNTLHNSTSQKYIRRLISFHEGSEVSAWELADNERFLRKMSIFHDVLIKLMEVDEDHVDVYVICEDVFSLALELGSDLSNYTDVSLYHKNLFGIGHQLILDYGYDKRNDQKNDYSLNYKAKNLNHSYINVNVGIQDKDGGRGFTASIERDFVLSSTKWAGLLSFKGIKHAKKLPLENKKNYSTDFNYSYFDSWLGYSHTLFNNYRRVDNITMAGAYKNIRLTDTPTKVEILPYYMNRSRYLGSFTLTKRQYFKTNYIHDLGKSEDIVEGNLLNLTLGFESNDTSDLFYSGLNLAKAWFSKSKMKYFGAHLALGAFYNENKIERGVISFKAQSVSKLFKLKKTLMRFNSSVSYLIGFNRYPEDFIYFTDYVRGLNSKDIIGNQKLSIKITQNFFVPYVINGFRTSVFAFADMGMIGSNRKAIYNTEKYYGFGLGIKFNNDNLIFRTFSICLAYYPRVPDDFMHFKSIVNTSSSEEFINLDPKRPEILKYE